MANDAGQIRWGATDLRFHRWSRLSLLAGPAYVSAETEEGVCKAHSSNREGTKDFVVFSWCHVALVAESYHALTHTERVGYGMTWRLV
jgi:hypothetical protein